MAETFSVTLLLPDMAATLALGRVLSGELRCGDFVGLIGPLGAGKTTLARGLIQALQHGGEPEEVVSPTFTLVQSYDTANLTIAHFDLYRIEEQRDIVELGLDDALDLGSVLVEWPDRLGSDMPQDRLDVELMITDLSRHARLTGHGDWAVRLQALDTKGVLGERVGD